jgi:hypothetical protein
MLKHHGTLRLIGHLLLHRDNGNGVDSATSAVVTR